MCLRYRNLYFCHEGYLCSRVTKSSICTKKTRRDGNARMAGKITRKYVSGMQKKHESKKQNCKAVKGQMTASIFE